MRSILFIIAILALIGAGVYFALLKSGNEVSLSTGEGEVIPVSEWHSVLIGNWNFKNVIKDNQLLHLYEGEIQYNANGEFKRFVTYKLYQCYYAGSPPPKIEPDCLHIVAGGGYSGKWGVDTSGLYFWENIEKCNMNSSRIDQGYKYGEPCNGYAPNTLRVFGNYAWDNEKNWVKIFTQNKIVVEGKNFTGDQNITYSFERTGK